MKCERPLSDLYQRYIAGNLPKKDFEGRLFQYLLDNLKRYRVFERDKNHWNEFISWLYPRLVRAIDLYRDLGSSFDAYITGLVQKASREYQRREADHRITEYTCWQARAQEMLVCETEAEYLTPKTQPRPPPLPLSEPVAIPTDIKPRQILLLLLKSYFFATDEFVSRVSHAIGMKTEIVMKMIDELRNLRSEKEREMLSLRDRVHCQYYRCLTYQKRMEAAQVGTEIRKKMEGRYQRAKIRALTMRKRLKKMRLGAPNRMIAEVTGIPKGTVDSSLFAIKNHLASVTNSIV